MKETSCPVQDVPSGANGLPGSCGLPEIAVEPSLLDMLARQVAGLEKSAAATESLVNVVGALVYQNAILIEMITGQSADENEPTKYMDGTPIYPKGSKDN